MKTYRVMAVVLIILILAEFVMMAIALFKGNYTQFSIDGGVLIAMILAGFLLKRAVKHREEQEEAGKEAEVPDKEE